MTNASFFIGLSVPFKNKCAIYPPTINQVLSTPDFAKYLQLLTLTSDDLLDEFKDKLDTKIPTPFEYLLINCYYSKEFLQCAKEAFQFFIHEDVTFLFQDKQILIGNIEKLASTAKSVQDLRFLTEEDYFDFQNLIRRSIGNKPVAPAELIDPNEDPRITRMKQKARLRDRIKAKKGTANSISTATSLVSICCMGLGITPLNIGEMSFSAIEPLMSVYQGKERYHLDIDSLLAGADSKKIKPKYWIANSQE